MGRKRPVRAQFVPRQGFFRAPAGSAQAQQDRPQLRAVPILKSSVCVLVPAYNEEKRIGAVVAAVRALNYPVLVVDDGSRDATSQAAKDAGARVMRSEDNRGKGVAIRAGLDWVRQNGFEGVIVMDADGQHDPAELETFRRTLKPVEADVVVGNRMGRPRGMSFLRIVTNLSMSLLLSIAARRWVPDTQCGYRALTQEALNRISLKTSRFEIESEIILEAARKKLKIVSIPVRSVYRDEVSRIRPFTDTLRFLRFFVWSLIRRD